MSACGASVSVRTDPSSATKGVIYLTHLAGWDNCEGYTSIPALAATPFGEFAMSEN